MIEPDRLMSDVFRIVSGALRLDVSKVRNYTEFLAERLEAADERSLAVRLRALLKETDHSLRPLGMAATNPIPVDADSRFPLIERMDPRRLREPPLVLGEDKREVVTEFISVAKSYAQLEAAGVASNLSLLLYGPPGCGKNRLARHIASELGLDLCIARLDGVISSYLGSTAKNIRALFDFAARTPCVLFLDEFDAIAKVRGDSQELGELKRVVNSFLQNLDSLGPQSIVIAATNHDELLDRAVWRRFAYRIKLEYPAVTARLQMWQAFLVDHSNRDTELLADLSEGFSGADIQEACRRIRRRAILRKGEPSLVDAFQALLNLSTGEGKEHRFLAGLVGKDARAVAAALRRRNTSLYSLSAIADLVGVSKATAHRLTSRTQKGGSRG